MASPSALSLCMSGLLALILLSITVPTVVDADVAIIQQYYEYLRRQDTTIFAANVFTQDTTRIVYQATVALGTSDIAKNYLNFADSSVRMNGVGELLVAMAIMRLVQETVLPSIDTAIPTTFLPRGVSFFNPNNPGTLLTLRHLLTHKSTITDAKFDLYKKTSPDPVVSLRAFIEGYFLQSSGGTFTVAPDVWFSGTPGADSSFRYAKVNVALLAFIIEQAIVTRPSLVGTNSQQTVAAYIQEKILTPLGMSSTFLRNLDGSFPTVSYPSLSPFFTGKPVNDYSSAGAVELQTTTHPAYPVAYMYYTTATDIGRLMRSVFLDTNGIWKSAGTSMKDSPFIVASSNGATSAPTTTAVLRGQTSQAQGLMFFSGATMCSVALATNIITKCPLVATSVIWGHMSNGEWGQVGTFCTDTASATNPTCVSTTISFYNTGSSLKTMDYTLGLAAVALQEAIGDKSTVTSTTSTDDTTRRLYPLWVAMGISGVILFVFVASFITENLIQPAPVSAGVPVPVAMPNKF